MEPQVQDSLLLRTFTGDIDTFGGSDGMFFKQGRLVMVNVTPPDGLVTATFATDYTSAILENQPVATVALNRPSSVALRGDRLWVVNSQLDHVVDDGNGAIGTDPDFPFQIVGFAAVHALSN